jgi:N-acetyl-gamma-glutamylphosphate reductase
MSSVKAASPADSTLRLLLASHPRVELADEPSSSGSIEIDQGGWLRRVSIGCHKADWYGLIETADNNPLVCADHASTPGTLSTLIWIALAPIAMSGLILDQPAIQSSVNGSQDEVLFALEAIGLTDETTISVAEEAGNLVGLSAFVPIARIDRPSDLDDLYNEAYGRSLYIDSADKTAFDPDEIEGSPRAVYDLRFSPGEDSALLTIRVLADRRGKCGAAQQVHLLNVMCGFEENLGIPDRLT